MQGSWIRQQAQLRATMALLRAAYTLFDRAGLAKYPPVSRGKRLGHGMLRRAAAATGAAGVQATDQAHSTQAQMLELPRDCSAKPRSPRTSCGTHDVFGRHQAQMNLATGAAGAFGQVQTAGYRVPVWVTSRVRACTMAAAVSSRSCASEPHSSR